MYEFYFSPIRTDGVSQLRVLVVDALTEQVKQSLYSLDDVYAVLDWNAYTCLSSSGEKSAFLMDIIQNKIVAHVKDRGWELSSFEIAYNKIRKKNYQFREYYKKSILSPDKKYKAQVYFEYDYEKNATFVDFSDKKGNPINRVQFTPGGYSVISESIGAMRWLDSNHVIVYYMGVTKLGREHANNMRDYWVIGTDGSVEFHYPKAEAESINAHALYNLGIMYWDGKIILQDKSKGLEYIKQAASLKYKHAEKWLNINYNLKEEE
ncbi:hypothetical protein D0T84_19350 [Dysgonomonas sp. 521]|nr:hypothetical protein [Dysgonomonas sp. 521]